MQWMRARHVRQESLSKIGFGGPVAESHVFVFVGKSLGFGFHDHSPTYRNSAQVCKSVAKSCSAKREDAKIENSLFCS